MADFQRGLPCLLLGLDRSVAQLSGCTALHVAASRGQVEMVKFLLEAGATIGATSLVSFERRPVAVLLQNPSFRVAR